MAKGTGPIAVVENKSGSVSKTVPIPQGTGGGGSTSNLAAPKAQRASDGHSIKNAGLGFKQDGRMQANGVSLTTGFTRKAMGSPTQKSKLDKAGVQASE